MKSAGLEIYPTCAAALARRAAGRFFAWCAVLLVSCSAARVASAGPAALPQAIGAAYTADVRPLVQQYCSGCHSAEKHKGSLDLERFATLVAVRKDLKAWQAVAEMVEAGEMPPEGKLQPTADERRRLVAWVRGLMDAEARARAGDPGRVPLRRLSNAEYDYTIRDLTGVDLRPTREFPADGAAGEGFANAAEALTDVSPTLLNKYLLASKDVAAHAVLLPDGFRFSDYKTRRDWSDESLAELRKFYAPFARDGRLPLQPYLAATIRHRDALLAGRATPEDVAAKESLNPKYLRILWETLTDDKPSFPLDVIRARWRRATEKDAGSLAAGVAAWQAKAWKVVPIGSYRHGDAARQVPNDAAASEAQTTRPATKPAAASGKDESGAAVAAPDGVTRAERVAGLEAFRRAFPLFVCFPQVIPTDETVCLKMYHREDEPLIRLFLDDAQRQRIDRLWAEHRFIAQQPLAEDRYLPLFIGFVTQDQPKELVRYFEGLRPEFRKRADDFEAEWESAAPRQLDALADFAARAYRRPLADKERADLLELYHGLRAKGVSHEDAFRGVLARVLVSSSFLFRIEQAPPGEEPGPVDDWELATRLGYFLWSSVPDDALRATAAAGRLRDPDVLAQQARRMLAADRVRALGVEFGTQWVHVRGFDRLKDKSERLFPGFDDKLRAAISEESILFFQDLFQQDRPVTRILDADYTYLNDTLAAHYGIPGVAGPQWRRVEGVRKYGRGGVLGLASVQATQAGASRTSPVLRGNWVLETLLGERLPRPPADVPRLPEEEGADGLTTRQMVERHTSVASCQVCHQRIDPIGFSLERYDPIGSLREKESTGRPVDCRATLKDGTEFEGIDGLRDYLLAKKKDVIVRLFCRRLLGYALGRAVTVSDQLLLDDMVAALDKNDGRLSAAVLAIVRSPQFRFVRGSAFGDDE